MAEVIGISDSDEEAAAAEEEEEAAEAAPEATESLTPQAGRPLVDELDLVAITALTPRSSGAHIRLPFAFYLSRFYTYAFFLSPTD